MHGQQEESSGEVSPVTERRSSRVARAWMKLLLYTAGMACLMLLVLLIVMVVCALRMKPPVEIVQA